MTKKMKIGLGVGAGVIAVTALGLGLGLGLSGGGTTDVFGKYYVVPAQDTTDGRLNAYRAAKSNGAEVILASGFTHGEPIVKAIEDQKDFFGETGFVLLDEKLNGNSEAAYQTFSMNFRADLGSIQTGIAAAWFLNTNQAAFDSIDESNHQLSYSMWGGQPFNSVYSFMGGFQLGVNWANANLTGKMIPQEDGSDPKAWINVEQTFGKEEWTGGFGETSGIEIQQDIIRQNADLIMPVAGPQLFTAQSEIIRRGTPQLLIGVDSAGELDPRVSQIENEKLKGITKDNTMIIFSSLKDLGKPTEIVLNLINNGNKLPDGESATDPKYDGMLVEHPTEGWVGGFGVSGVGNTTNGMVGVSGIGVGLADTAFTTSTSTGAKPWLDPINSEWEQMVYTGLVTTAAPDGKFWYGTHKLDAEGAQVPNTVVIDGNTVSNSLSLEASINIPAGTTGENPEWANYDKVIDNKKDFIKKDQQTDEDKAKLILSSPGSILLDASFSQSLYVGLKNFMFTMGIDIPSPPGWTEPKRV